MAMHLDVIQMSFIRYWLFKFILIKYQKVPSQWYHKHHDISSYWQLNCLFNNLVMLTTKKESKHGITDPLRRESKGDGGFPSQRASNVESITILYYFVSCKACKIM